MPRQLPSLLWQTYRFMSQDVAKIIPFLQKTACMNQTERELIGYCEFAKEVFKDDEDFCYFLDKVAIPFFELVGRAKWRRTEITDLGLAKGRRGRKAEDTKDILDINPEDLE